MDDENAQGDSSNSLLNLTGAASSGVTPLEQEVLDEYERLLRNMIQVRCYSSSRVAHFSHTLSAAVSHIVDIIKWSHNIGSR